MFIIDFIKKLKIEKLIEYILYSFAFFLPLQTRWIIKEGMIGGGAWEYGTYSLYFTDIILIIILAMTGWMFLNRRLDLRKTDSVFLNKYSLIFLGIFLLSAFFSIFAAPDKMLAGYIFLRLLSGVFIFWAVSRLNFDKIYLLFSFVFGVTLQAILGIWQFLSQTNFASKWLGIALHNPANPGVSVIETLNGERWLRAYGGMDHPNILGGVLVISIFLLLSILVQNNRLKIFNFSPFGDAQFSIFNKFSIFPHSGTRNFQFLKFFLLFTFYFLLLTSLFFTFSRSAWIALLVGIIFLLAAFAITKKIFELKGLFMILLSGGILMFILFSIFSNLISTRFSGETRLEAKSYEERVDALSDFTQIIKTNWLIGTGIGSYGLALNKIDPGQTAWRYQPVHNTFLLAWGEIGIIGFLGYLGLLGCLGLSLLNKKNYYGAAILISLALLMMADHWLWSLHFGLLFFYFILGIILILKDEELKIQTYLQNIKNKL